MILAMGHKEANNFAYIDGANLHKGIEEQGWSLDYGRFRVWLRDKYSVQRAYLFLGLVPKYKDMYTNLQEIGYTLVFKEVVSDGKGAVKGNCDADLVLRLVSDAYEGKFNKSILVSGDGDFASTIKFLQEKDKLAAVVVPNRKKILNISKENAGSNCLYG
jgi:uncharacterized LabA/DUF88 family protein